MGNIHSAQNVAAYFVYECNDAKKFINDCTIQQLLAEVDVMWKKAFGHCAFHEQTLDFQNGIYIKDVHDAYKEHGNKHITEPAKEWFLKYGEFQLILRPYAVPNFNAKEQIVIRKAINRVYKIHKQALAG